VNKKRIYIKILAAILVTTSLYGCSNTSTTDTAKTTGTAAKAATSSAVKTSIIGDKAVSTVIGEKVTYEENDNYSDWSTENPNYIELKGTTAELKGTGAEIKDNKITITKAGTYVLSGKLDNGQILVDESNKGVVRLVLNGVVINYGDGSPIYVKNAGKTIISLQEGTENSVTDGEKYVLEDASSDEPSAAIFIKDSLTINGTGKLIVNGNTKTELPARMI
jgi:hypothetical protein